MDADRILRLAALLEPDMLPGDLPEIAEIVGIESALRIASKIGGIKIYIPRWTDDSSKWTWAITDIVSIVGSAAARNIALHFTGHSLASGCHIKIPKCSKLFRKMEQIAILETLAETGSPLLTARRHGCTEEWVYALRRKYPQIPSDKQQNLFFKSISNHA